MTRFGDNFWNACSEILPDGRVKLRSPSRETESLLCGPDGRLRVGAEPQPGTVIRKPSGCLTNQRISSHSPTASIPPKMYQYPWQTHLARPGLATQPRQPRVQATLAQSDSAQFLVTAEPTPPRNQVTAMHHAGIFITEGFQGGTYTDAAADDFAHEDPHFVLQAMSTTTLASSPAANLSQPQIPGIPGDGGPARHYTNPQQPRRDFPLSNGTSQQRSSMASYDGSFAQYPTHFSQEVIEKEHNLYPSPPSLSNLNHYPAQDMDTTQDQLEMPGLSQENHVTEAPSPGRSRPVPKPDREVTKNENGRFVCMFAGCTEEVRDFGRKCEWSKHMDKHDRPYRCPAEGCEKLPGFTYSGGLLRHEREVHGKHGGPKKHLNCPHQNCKRASGKGFSRQENLNEHLRRVHTTDVGIPNGEETEDDGEEKTGNKRKRGPGRSDSIDLREEMKRLKEENEELRKTSEQLALQTAAMQQQLEQLQNQANARDAIQARAQQAPMM